MDSELLTFHTPKAENTLDVQAKPSAAVEFAYAYFSLVRGQKSPLLPWHTELLRDDPTLTDALREFWQDPSANFDLFHLVSNGGYIFDLSLARFFDDLELHLPLFLEQVSQYKAMLQQPDSQKAAKELAASSALEARLERLKNKSLRHQFLGLLRRLWAFLEPRWVAEGLNASQAACQRFGEQFAQHQDILAALPIHHFVQFESSQEYIRQAMQRGSVLVIPLYFAWGGGFSVDARHQHLIGYGIHSEDSHDALAHVAMQLALQLKALADPTRLMLMMMLQKYHYFDLSVSDFASQLGVTQPTISGHLKLLRESGMVVLEKKGNKSLYKLETEVLQAMVKTLKTQFGLPEIS